MPAVPPGSQILVTGANGYVATYLIQELLDQGFAVRGTVRSISKNTFLLDKFKSYGNKFELVEIEDYTKESAFDEVVKDVDAIQHVAAPMPDRGYSDPYDHINPIVLAMVWILHSARDAPNVKRIVVVSSVASILHIDTIPRVFDGGDWNEQCLQNLEKMGKDSDPITTYLAEKILSEKAAWAFCREFEKQLSWDLVVFGPHHKFVLAPDQLSCSSKAFYDLLIGKPVQEAITVNHSYIDVRDVALGLVKSMNVAEAGGERIIISARPYTHQEWLGVVKSLKPQITPD